MDIKEALAQVVERRDLDHAQMTQVMNQIMTGLATQAQIGAFLMGLRMKGETVAEIAAAAQVMRDLATRVEVKLDRLVDTCGTGGDGKNTFNISTLASFIAAGAGQNVAKHGNNGVSSICGSSNLMAQFGYSFTNNVDQLKREMDAAGISFLHAPLFHPAMKNVAPIRKELGVKTFFNMLGPMVNPAFPPNQVVGVFNLELARLYGYLYQKTGKDFVILHALDGYDEISLTGPFKMISDNKEEIISPESLGFQTHSPTDLEGGDTVEEAAKIFVDILKGAGSIAQNEVVIANAGFAIYCGNKDKSLADAIAAARESLESGKAYAKFKALMDTSSAGK